MAIIVLDKWHFRVICIALPWLPLLPSARRTNFTTTSSTAPAFRAVLASSTRPISAALKRLPPCSRSAPLRFPPRVGSARSPLVSRPAIWRLRFVAVPLGTTPLRSLPGSLPVAGGDAPHLRARSQDRGGRLVWADHSLSPLGLRAGALLPPSLLGLLRATPAGERSFGAKRRTRPAGGSASPPARPVEGETARQPPLAGLRHHQLSHLHCHHQHPQHGGAARP